MAVPDPEFYLSHLNGLLQVAFLINVAYLVVRNRLDSPLRSYVQLERGLRKRLARFKGEGDERVGPHRKHITAVSRRSEGLLRALLRLSTVSLYVGTVVSFVLLAAAGFADRPVNRGLAALLVVVIYMPLPLSLLTLWTASRLYLGKLEREVVALAKTLEVWDEAAKETAGAATEEVVEAAMSHIEEALERGNRS